MIIETYNNRVGIDHNNIGIVIEGHVKLIYEDNGLTIVVDSIPKMFFNDVNIRDIKSDITIECEPEHKYQKYMFP